MVDLSLFGEVNELSCGDLFFYLFLIFTFGGGAVDKKKLLDLIGENLFFDEFFWDEKEDLVQLLNDPAEYPAGEIILEQGQEDSSLFILLDGEVRVTKNEFPEEELTVLTPGTVFGSIPSLLSKPRATNMIAKTPVIALRFAELEFSEMDSKIMSKFKDRFIDVLFQRIEKLNTINAKLQEKLNQAS